VKDWTDVPLTSPDDERVVASGAAWVVDEYRDAVLHADQNRGKDIVGVRCPSCPRTIVGRVFRTPEGPLFVADVLAPGELRQVGIDWSESAGYDGQVPAAFSPVRVLFEHPDSHPYDCLCRCDTCERDLVVDAHRLRAEVARFRRTGTRRTVPASARDTA
jgi:hypothetical protein